MLLLYHVQSACPSFPWSGSLISTCSSQGQEKWLLGLYTSTNTFLQCIQNSRVGFHTFSFYLIFLFHYYWVTQIITSINLFSVMKLQNGVFPWFRKSLFVLHLRMSTRQARAVVRISIRLFSENMWLTTSAKSHKSPLVTLSGRSFTYKRKKVCPRLEPWGTPVFMGEDTADFTVLTTLSCPVCLRTTMVSVFQIRIYPL